MRKEILRMEHIVCMKNNTPELKHFSMQIFEGEIFGILCLERHGISKMVELICRNGPIQYGQVILGERLVNSIEIGDNSRNPVSLIDSRSGLIDNLSLADNLFALQGGKRFSVLSEKEICRRAVVLLKELGIEFSPSMAAGQITTYDRMVTELLRAVVNSSKLIILWQISDLLSSEEQPRFHKLIRKLTKMGYSFLYIYNHHEVLRLICDRLGVFQDGHIEKILLETEALEPTMTRIYARYTYEKLKNLKTDSQRNLENQPEVLHLSHIYSANINDLSLTLRAGETLLVLDQSNTMLHELFDILAANNKDYEGQIYPNNREEKNKRQIALIPRKPIENALFHELSFLDNLCLPLGEKTHLFWQKKHLRESVAREYRKELGSLLDARELYDLHSIDLYTLVYYRYLISGPKLVVCMQPLSGVDMYIRTHILEMITKLCEKGIAVLILNTELYDTLYAADRLIRVENGRIIGNYTRNHFEELRVTHKEIYPD